MLIEPASPRIIRAKAARRAAAGSLAVLAGALLISACGSSETSTSTTQTKVNLNTARVARSIEENISAQRHLKSTVVCPTVVAQEQGKTFECTATTHTSKRPSVAVTTQFVVTVQNSKGYVTFVGK